MVIQEYQLSLNSDLDLKHPFLLALLWQQYLNSDLDFFLSLMLVSFHF